MQFNFRPSHQRAKLGKTNTRGFAVLERIDYGRIGSQAISDINFAWIHLCLRVTKRIQDAPPVGIPPQPACLHQSTVADTPQRKIGIFRTTGPLKAYGHETTDPFPIAHQHLG